QGGPAGTQAAQATVTTSTAMMGSSGMTDSSTAAGTAASPVGQAAAVVRLRDVVTPPHEGIDEQGRPMIVGGGQLGAQQYDQTAPLDGQPTVALTIYGLPGANALDTAASVRSKMEELKRRFPEGLDYKIAYDTTPFIRQSVREVYRTLIDATALVALV